MSANTPFSSHARLRSIVARALAPAVGALTDAEVEGLRANVRAENLELVRASSAEVHAALHDPRAQARILGRRNLLGFTYAHMFVKMDALDALDELLSFATRKFIDVADTEGATALFYACRLGRERAVAALIAAGADVHKAAASSTTPLSAATCAKCAASATHLLQAGAHVDAPNASGWTPLHHASMHGFTSGCRLLLEHGARIDAVNVYGRTPLMIAAANQRDDVVTLLLEQGARSDARDMYGDTYMDHGRKGGP